MTRVECEVLQPGMRCMISERFVEEPHPDIERFLGTIQVVDKVAFDTVGWVYFEDVPQPFAMSEIDHIVYDEVVIDDENVPYECGSFDLLFKEA